jgi:hypothetical protein
VEPSQSALLCLWLIRRPQADRSGFGAFPPSNYLAVFWVDSAFDSTRGTVRTGTSDRHRTADIRVSDCPGRVEHRCACFVLLIVRNHQCSRTLLLSANCAAAILQSVEKRLSSRSTKSRRADDRAKAAALLFGKLGIVQTDIKNRLGCCQKSVGFHPHVIIYRVLQSLFTAK